MKTLKTLACASVLALSMNVSKAGLGLAWESVTSIAHGHYLLASMGTALSVASIRTAIYAISYGQISYGAFFLVLKENNVITGQDLELLNNAEVSVKEAFVEIMTSEEMTAEEKQEELSSLFE